MLWILDNMDKIIYTIILIPQFLKNKKLQTNQGMHLYTLGLYKIYYAYSCAYYYVNSHHIQFCISLVGLVIVLLIVLQWWYYEFQQYICNHDNFYFLLDLCSQNYSDSYSFFQKLSILIKLDGLLFWSFFKKKITNIVVLTLLYSIFFIPQELPIILTPVLALFIQILHNFKNKQLSKLSKKTLILIIVSEIYYILYTVIKSQSVYYLYTCIWTLSKSVTCLIMIAIIFLQIDEYHDSENALSEITDLLSTTHESINSYIL